MAGYLGWYGRDLQSIFLPVLLSIYGGMAAEHLIRGHGRAGMKVGAFLEEIATTASPAQLNGLSWPPAYAATPGKMTVDVALTSSGLVEIAANCALRSEWGAPVGDVHLHVQRCYAAGDHHERDDLDCDLQAEVRVRVAIVMQLRATLHRTCDNCDPDLVGAMLGSPTIPSRPCLWQHDLLPCE
jgi:hypothetical protein